MTQEKENLKVIYRKFPADPEQPDTSPEVIAFFPTLAGTNRPATCTSYMHVGQHSSANIALATELEAATAEEYMPLHKELQRIYDDCTLVIAHKPSAKDYFTRAKQVA